MSHQFVNLSQVELEGLTGSIRFTEEGRRQNFTVDVMEMSVHSTKVKVSLPIGGNPLSSYCSPKLFSTFYSIINIAITKSGNSCE